MVLTNKEMTMNRKERRKQAKLEPIGYEAKMAEAARAWADGRLAQGLQAGTGLVSVEHEDHCRRPSGGPCVCRPTVSVKGFGKEGTH